ncbi:PLP-dependent cysteine synthase family protein [uncultured Adlercreutzia sp.]|uniref:PLP-dependent cysteine synthase family protein n=1 Tax=uncultured Adlercreutzia sp. TaxID=875803 RepID=UPI0025EFBEBD|nr:cysteine synthase family protein [uncultured Adlercreutzia sp.]MCI9261270.1 cysteine synthase family protein [Eggerthellaceae bacterium]
MICDNVLEVVGSTPLVRLNHLTGPNDAQVLVKFEGVNVGGSVKTRTALKMIEEAEARGEVTPDSIIVEPTSGNQGVGLALVCAVKGLKARIIMPDSCSEERRKIMEHYGAEVILVHDEGDIGACIEECIALAQKLAAEDPRVFVPQQFVNRDNLAAHVAGTAAEILADAAEAGLVIDGFCSGFGTGGTITGIGSELRRVNPAVQIWAAEPEHAALLSGGAIGTHVQMGIGDGILPAIMNTELIDEIVIVSDEEALDVSRRLAREEGLFCGISSGTNVACALKLARKLGPGKTVVTLAPDTGERYFSTSLFV